MFPNVNPKQMSKMMAKMGIKSEEVDAERVVIEKRDGSTLVVSNPSVTKVIVQGKASFQVAGEVSEGAAQKQGGDAEIIVKETNCPKEEAEKALKECNNDLAEAILRVQDSTQ